LTLPPQLAYCPLALVFASLLREKIRGVEMEDTIGWIIAWTFMAVAVVFPLFVIVQTIVNFMRASDGRGTIVIKALVVLGIWAGLSFICVMLTLMYTFEAGRGVDRATGDRRMMILTLVLTLIYIAVGLVLAYWVRLQPIWKRLRKAESKI
jgi:hypothetical protein